MVQPYHIDKFTLKTCLYTSGEIHSVQDPAIINASTDSTDQSRFSVTDYFKKYPVSQPDQQQAWDRKETQSEDKENDPVKKPQSDVYTQGRVPRLDLPLSDLNIEQNGDSENSQNGYQKPLQVGIKQLYISPYIVEPTCAYLHSGHLCVTFPLSVKKVPYKLRQVGSLQCQVAFL